MVRYLVLFSLLLFTRPLFALDCWGQFYQCVDDSNLIRQCVVSRDACFGVYPGERHTDQIPSLDSTVECARLSQSTDRDALAREIESYRNAAEAARTREAAAEQALTELSVVLANNGNDQVIQDLMAGSLEEARVRKIRAHNDLNVNLAIVGCASERLAALPGDLACPDIAIVCAEPPAGFHYEPEPPNSDPCHLSCGRLVRNDDQVCIQLAVVCALPPPGYHYVPPSEPCPLTCGALVRDDVVAPVVDEPYDPCDGPEAASPTRRDRRIARRECRQQRRQDRRTQRQERRAARRGNR